MPDVYRCPHGCITQYPITTLRGWKRHMTAKHGRFTDAELEAASRGDTSDDVSSRMASFASTIEDGRPVDIKADGSVVDTASQQPVGTATAPALPTLEPEKRKVRATPKRLTQLLVGIPEKILESLAVTPDREDREALEEAASFLEDVFGVNFEVDESKTTIRSRWWAFAWVSGVMGLIWLKHKGAGLLNLVQEKPPEGPTV
jgi:hypothetical protein